MDKIELLGGACFSHGPYTFYKAVRISSNRVLRLGSFFLTKLWSDADLVSIGELQLLWIDSRGPNTPLASLRLYFLPENTPDGRRDTHGEDEVLTISEKVVVRVHDLVTWLSPSLEWSWGREVSYPPTPSSSPDSSPHPQVLSDPGLDFSDVERHQKDLEALASVRRGDTIGQTKVVVLSYPRYCRYRALLQRLKGSEPSWLCSSIAAALGGFTALPGTRVLFCRDTFDYPDLETHELLCNHLAPKLKGRPRRKRKKRSVSPGESSNESEASVASSVAASSFKGSSSSSGQSSTNATGRPASSAIRRSERKTSAEEKRFVSDVQTFMTSRNTPLGKMPLLGYRQIDLFLFYTKVQDLGGYDRVSANRLWKLIYDEMGGNTGSTSAATITRRHYERLLLPYERCQKGEETKVRPNHGSRRIKTPSISDVSEDSIEVKRETESPPPSETPPPTEITNSMTVTSPLQSILAISPFLSGEKPRSESGKTSSLRSVRVKPERLKSLNTIIATSNPAPANQQQLPSSPGSLLISTPSSNTTSSSATSSPTSTPPSSTTPTNGGQHSVLERQLNSPLLTQQVPSSCSPPGLPVSTVTTNATTVVTLTPPPEKDMKEIKLDPKQTSLLAHGKENIPLFEEKSPIFVDKPNVAPRSPEVIDLETENETGTRDKLIIPSFKKRKLEILREGGLEVTPVELDARPSVIQPTTTSAITAAACLNASATTTASPSAASPLVTATIVATVASSSTFKQEDKPVASGSLALPPTTVLPKLINVTVTPDIGRMLPRLEEPRVSTVSPIRPQPVTPVKQHQGSTNQGGNGSPTSQIPGVNSRIINLGSSNNATLLQLYANANVPVPHSLSAAVQANQRFVPSLAPMANGRSLPPKVTQSRSIFGNNEKMVYGNPKDILVAPKYLPSILTQPHLPRNSSALSTPNMRCREASAGGVLDLTQKPAGSGERPSFGRPNLEIVRVPVVPRPNPLNLEAHHRSAMSLGGNHCKDLSVKVPPPPPLPPPLPSDATAVRKGHFVAGNLASSPAGYANVLDSRTMTTNNLEITLVSPKKSGGTIVGQPQLSPPSRNNNTVLPVLPVQRRQQQQQHHLNGKFPTRLPAEPVSPYTPRKPLISCGGGGGGGHHPVIPNVPNLSHLNVSGASSFSKVNQTGSYQQLAMEKRKTSLETDVNNKDPQRRISEGDKISMQQQQQRGESGPATSSKQQHSRETEATSRRHSVPSLPTSFMTGMPPNSPSFLAHQLVAAANNSSPASPAAAAAAAAAAGKFLPILDPMYYSAFYNGLFPGTVPANTGPNPFLPPEFSAYYKELLASSSSSSSASAQQTRLQHQPAAPTSK